MAIFRQQVTMFPWSGNFLQKALYGYQSGMYKLIQESQYSILSQSKFWLLLDLHKLHTYYLYLLQKPCLFARGIDTYVVPSQSPSHLGVVSTIDSSIVICLLRAMGRLMKDKPLVLKWKINNLNNLTEKLLLLVNKKLTLQSTFTYCGDLQVAFFLAYLVSSSQHVDTDFIL